MRNVLLLAAVALLGACAQLTTNDSEEAQLLTAAEHKAQDYLACISREAAGYAASSTDASFIVDAVKGSCVAEMEQYAETQKIYLAATVMMPAKPLMKSIEALESQARQTIADQVVRGGSNSAAAAFPAAAAAALPVARSKTVPPVPTVGSGNWTPEQRVYLDCMLDQANRYAMTQESAEVIAEVASSRCSSYLGGSNVAELSQEGRTLVLGTILDAKLNTTSRK